MPLHLLGKKSWNVYNADNIEKVKEDEAVAAAKEEAEEQRLQDIDAERRLRILRSGEPQDTESIEQKAPIEGHNTEETLSRSSRKERRRRGEDDTDRDIRLARARQLQNSKQQIGNHRTQQSSNAPLIDAGGHVALFLEETRLEERRSGSKRKRKEDVCKEDIVAQSAMRFSDAAGYKEDITRAPWYFSRALPNQTVANTTTSPDARRNDDCRRRDRQALRLEANDPLAAMKRGVKQLKDTKRERSSWQRARRREVTELDAAEEPMHDYYGRRHTVSRHKGKHESPYLVDVLSQKQYEPPSQT